MNTNKFSLIPLVIPITLVIYLGIFATHALHTRKTVYGDGIFYYSWVRSWVVDRDINFTDEYAHFGVRDYDTPGGPPGNKFAVGPAAFWLLPYITVYLIAGGDGYGLIYQWITGLTGVLCAVTGLVLLYRIMAGYYGSRIAAASTMITAFGTGLLYYGAYDTVNSHALSFTAATLFLTFVLQNRIVPAGIAIGFAGLIRLQDVIAGLILGHPNLRKRIPGALIGFLAVFMIQPVIWYIQYGTLFRSPYLYHEKFNLLQPQLAAVLLDPGFGLFSTTPLTALGLIGLIGSTPAISGFTPWFVGIIGAQIYLVSSWGTWWQGASYGGRMFTAILPFLSLGLADLLYRTEKKSAVQFRRLMMVGYLGVFANLVRFITAAFMP